MTSKGDLNITGGEVCPAGDNIFGTIVVEGDYTQSSNATFLNAEVDSVNNTDLVDILGTASLDGGLVVEAAVGNFVAGQRITILQAAGQMPAPGDKNLGATIMGNFDPTMIVLPTLPNGDPLFVVEKTGTSIDLVVQEARLFDGQNPAPGNAQTLVNCLQEIQSQDPFQPGEPLTQAIQVMGLLNDADLTNALYQTSPISFGALEWVNLTEMSWIATLLTQRNRIFYCSAKQCDPRAAHFRPNGLYVEPYGI